MNPARVFPDLDGDCRSHGHLPDCLDAGVGGELGW
jgi:hypothetical protein